MSWGKIEVRFTMKNQIISAIFFRLEEQIDVSERLFDTWPILVYPCRIYNDARGQLRSPKPDQMVPGADYAMFNDLGVYGVPKPVKEKQR